MKCDYDINILHAIREKIISKKVMMLTVSQIELLLNFKTKKRTLNQSAWPRMYYYQSNKLHSFLYQFNLVHVLLKMNVDIFELEISSTVLKTCAYLKRIL